MFQEIARRRAPIRGLVIDGDVLRGVIVSRGALPLRPAREPYLTVITDDLSGGTPRIAPGGTATVQARGFCRRRRGPSRRGSASTARWWPTASRSTRPVGSP